MSREPNRAERVYALLARRGCYVDTFALEKVGGRRSWRTALSEARRHLAQPNGEDIVNKQQRKRIGKRTWTDSTYALVKRSGRAAVKAMRGAA